MKKTAQKAAAPINLGSKRVCPKCGTKFYDFGKSDEVECPKCRSTVDVDAAAAAVPPAVETAKKAPKAKDLNEEVLVEDEAATPEGEAEFESLEDLEEDEDDLVEDLEVEGEDGEGDF